MGKNKCKRSHFSGSILVFSTYKSPDGSRKPENQLLGSYGIQRFLPTKLMNVLMRSNTGTPVKVMNSDSNQKAQKHHLL